MRFLLVTFLAGTYASFAKFERNLVFRSPFLNDDAASNIPFAVRERSYYAGSSVAIYKKSAEGANSFPDGILYPLHLSKMMFIPAFTPLITRICECESQITKQQPDLSRTSAGGGAQINRFVEGRELATILNFDAWDGYRANRNRILDQLYDEQINNVAILSGNSHANWVSDLAHINDTKTYNPLTGEGARGVELAFTAVTSSSGFPKEFGAAYNASLELVNENADLQWSEGFYRGFMTLTIDTNNLNANFYGMRNISNWNLDGIKVASFNIKNKANRLTRPVSDGKILSGALKPGNH